MSAYVRSYVALSWGILTPHTILTIRLIQELSHLLSLVILMNKGNYCFQFQNKS